MLPWSHPPPWQKMVRGMTPFSSFCFWLIKKYAVIVPPSDTGIINVVEDMSCHVVLRYFFLILFGTALLFKSFISSGDKLSGSGLKKYLNP